MTDAAAHIVVKGLVQGVGFRFFVYNLGIKLGLRGYVTNLSNGDVAVTAEGHRSSIEELIKELKIGPRAAHVADLRIEWQIPEYRFDTFSVR